jgi:hypothetical protein
MNLREEPVNWEINPKDNYIPIQYRGEIVGFLRPQFASRIVQILNEEEGLRKALLAACQDVIFLQKGDPKQVKNLAREYIVNVKLPKYGTPVIIHLLKQRQRELDLSYVEFSNFCDSYKLSKYELQEILKGATIEDSWLMPLSRILGKSVEELQVIRDGK